MKTILFYAALICLSVSTYAKPVNEATANSIGLNFLLNNSGKAFTTNYTLKLAYKSVSASGSNTVYYYVFNADHGFVIVAGDDQATPIIGYSDEATFNGKDIPIHVTEWLNGYSTQIKYIVENNIAATPEISGKWSDLINGSSAAAPNQTSTGTPLLKTTWDQLPYYNDLCPYDNNSQRHAVTGCVATAMAQVMKFYEWPATGIGHHSYSDPVYGTQAANFDGTNYQWASMPNSLSGANTLVATAMYQCGVSVNMSYGVGESDAYVLASQSPVPFCAENALKTYFAYDKTLHGVLRSNYSDAAWINAMESEIDAGRPVIYTGTGSGGGHCFVCDGYRSADNFLHFNWGWGQLYNGYYSINSLNPGTAGTGSGSGTFNSNEQAIIGIKPSIALQSYNIGLNRNLSLFSSSIQYQDSFSLTTSFINLLSNSHDFTGNYAIEIFDSVGNLIDSVVSATSTLTKGSTSGTIKFSYPGSPFLLPGTYTIQAFIRPTGGIWSIVANNLYTNSAKIKVYWANTLELSAPIIVTPSAPLQTKSISVHLNAINTGANQFNGYFYAYLDDFNGYSHLLIQRDTGNLNANSSFANGLTFTNSADTVSPGTYLLVIYYSPDGHQFNLMGSTNYGNPVRVTIGAPPLPLDKYEPDNTVDSAYDMTPNFAMDSAEVRTVGANINTGDDVDFYKINVPPGYYFSFVASLYDTRNPASNQNYTLDGVVSFTHDSGTTWSDAYQGTMPAPASVNGKSVLIFQVAPIFPGITGTYGLDIKLKRNVGNGIENPSAAADLIKVYPNPASDIINIDFSSIHEKIKKLDIVDLTGKRVFTESNPDEKTKSQISISNLPPGLYFLQLGTDNGLINKQISIVR